MGKSKQKKVPGKRKKKKKGLKKRERAPLSQEKKKILAAMRLLSIQSLMISVTAAFSGLVAGLLFRMTHRLHMSPSLTNCGFIHDLPCLQVVAHLGILHQLCNCPQGTEHGLQYPDQHSWHAVIFNYMYKKNQIICLSACKATSCHWS